MKIISLVENTSSGNVKAVHGLSLYMETKKHKLLFDLGPNKTLFANARRKGIDLTQVDTVVISHGHKDHGGALEQFLQINKRAKVYVQESAFEPYYTEAMFLKIYVGLDAKLANHPQVVKVQGDYVIDEELALYVSKVEDPIRSDANKSLLCRDEPDNFRHEHNLMIHENQDVLIMGCGHSGVLSILASSGEKHPDYCIGGFHLYNPVTRFTVPQGQLQALAEGLQGYADVSFYTCHCTGPVAYRYLRERCGNVNYLACGDELVI